jgi:hypothetical protein
MSTPSSKAHNRGETQTQPATGINDPIHAPDLPPRAGQIGASGASGKDDPVVLAYAPKYVREAAARAKTEQQVLETPLCPDELPGGSGYGAAERVLDPQDVASLQRSGTADEQQNAQPSSARTTADDADLKRLEASLRWLQRHQAASMRLPPAANLPPPRVRSSDALGRLETMPEAIRPTLRSLEPTRLTPPPTGMDRYPNTMLAISIACTFLAAIVYGWMQIDQSANSTAPTEIPASQLASLAALSSAGDAADREQYSRPEGPLPASSETKTDEVAGAQSLSPAPTAPQATSAALPAAMASPPDTVGSLAPTTASAPDTAAPPVRTLSVEEVALLVEQGKKYIAVGDVVTARTIFRRAADAGNATAALALAATYDPIVLAKLGVLGMGADVEKARAWYQMAESYGSAEATERLQVLGK